MMLVRVVWKLIQETSGKGNQMMVSLKKKKKRYFFLVVQPTKQAIPEIPFLLMLKSGSASGDSLRCWTLFSRKWGEIESFWAEEWHG